MAEVWKFPVVPGRHEVSMPQGARALCVQLQHGAPWLWALVPDTDAPRETRTIVTVGTGHPFDHARLLYVGTFQVTDTPLGVLVFHTFIAAADALAPLYAKTS
jgi:hypothetical protein